MPNIWFTTQTLFINLFGRRSSKMSIPHSDFSSTTQGWSHQNTWFFDQLTRISLGCSPSLWKVLSFDRNQELFDYTFVVHDSILKTWSERRNMAWFVVAKCLQTPCVWTYLLRSVVIMGQGGTEFTARARQCHWTSSPRCHQHSGAQNRYQVCLAKPLKDWNGPWQKL